MVRAGDSPPGGGETSIRRLGARTVLPGPRSSDVLVRAVGPEDDMTRSFVDSLFSGLALDAALQDVADEAERVIPGVDAAGTVVHRGASQVLAASNPLAATVDAVQYRTGHGPCLQAFHTNTVVVLDLGDRDHRWPTFQTAALAAGAHTVLSVPLCLDEQPVGSLNLYSRTQGAFGPSVVEEAELFARPSALRLSRVGFAVEAVEAAEVASLELQDRATIDLALGVLMGLHEDASVERARVRLERTATDLGLTVPLAAARLVAAPLAPGQEEHHP